MKKSNIEKDDYIYEITIVKRYLPKVMEDRIIPLRSKPTCAIRITLTKEVDICCNDKVIKETIFNAFKKLRDISNDKSIQN